MVGSLLLLLVITTDHQVLVFCGQGVESPYGPGLQGSQPSAMG